MSLKSTLSILTALVAASSGGAAVAGEDGSGFYIAAGGTVSRLTDIKQVTSDAPAPGLTLTLFNRNETGWGGYGAVGRDFGPFRAEFEVGRTENDSDTFDIVSPFMVTIPQDGETDIWRYMANAYFDFGGEKARLRPYVGGGVGAARISAFRFAATAAAPNNPFVHFDDSGTTFAWQAMAGAALRVAPHLDLTAQYRWFDAGSPDLVTAAGQDFTIDVDGHHVDLGVRYSF